MQSYIVLNAKLFIITLDISFIINILLKNLFYNNVEFFMKFHDLYIILNIFIK